MSGPRQRCYQADVDANPETAVPPRSASGVSAPSPYRPTPEPRQRGPVCMECKHVMHRGNRWDGDQRLVCLADGPVVVSAGRFDHVTGRIVDRVEADPPSCRELNGEGQCERFEVDQRRLPPAPNPTRPSTLRVDDPRDSKSPRESTTAAAIGLAIGSLLCILASLFVEVVDDRAHERAVDSRGELGEP